MEFLYSRQPPERGDLAGAGRRDPRLQPGPAARPLPHARPRCGSPMRSAATSRWRRGGRTGTRRCAGRLGASAVSQAPIDPARGADARPLSGSAAAILVATATRTSTRARRARLDSASSDGRSRHARLADVPDRPRDGHPPLEAELEEQRVARAVRLRRAGPAPLRRRHAPDARPGRKRPPVAKRDDATGRPARSGGYVSNAAPARPTGADRWPISRTRAGAAPTRAAGPHPGHRRPLPRAPRRATSLAAIRTTLAKLVPPERRPG